MDMRSNSFIRMGLVLGVMCVIVAYHTDAAPAPESDSSRLANALLRLDDALDNLSAYFRDTKRAELENADSNTDQADQNNKDDAQVDGDVKRSDQQGAEEDDDDINDEPKPESDEKEARNEDAEIMNNQDGARPEFTAELDDMTERELAEVPDGEQALVEDDDEEKQEAVLKAALRYLLKIQKQERMQRQKKDYDIPFPIFGYKRGPNNE